MNTRDKEALRAARVLSDYCSSQGNHCGNCSINHVGCTRHVPADWQGLAELEDEPKEEKTLQIKTIRCRLDDFQLFDDAVNEALAGGWYLVKRYTIPTYSEAKYNMLVAELERKVPAHD